MKNLNFPKGFTLIEAIVVIFLVVVVAVAFYSVLSSAITGILESKKRLAAAEISTEKMELARNLEYNDIGTVSGEVYGVLPDREIISQDSGTFYIFTSVQYFDDPYDENTSNDYKKVRIKTSWEDDMNSSKSVTLISSFIPLSLENN